MNQSVKRYTHKSSRIGGETGRESIREGNRLGVRETRKRRKEREKKKTVKSIPNWFSLEVQNMNSHLFFSYNSQ
jgi:hypothetical protein